MHTSQLHYGMSYGVDTAKDIVNLRRKFIIIKRKLGASAAAGIISIGGLYFWYGFYKRRKKVQSLLKKEEFVINSPSEYRKAMLIMDEFNRILNPLERQFSKNPKVNFLPYKKGFFELKKTIDALGQYRDSLKECLEIFNHAPNGSHNNGFEFIPAEQLWQKRVKSYEYIA